jgi:hypothetical protein
MRRPFFAALAFVVGAAVTWVACLERTYYDPDACSPTLPCSGSRYCNRGTCGAPPDLSGATADLMTDDGPASCGGNTDCFDTLKPVCDLVAHSCRACVATNDMGATTECTGERKLCGPSGACAGCLSKDDCLGTNQACAKETLSCGDCKLHTDCTTGICKPNGFCAEPEKTVYVSQDACNAGNQMGTRALPYCQIQGALAAGKEFILVTGSGTPYMPVSISSGTFTLVGPGRGASPKATVGASGAPAFTITTTTQAATVTLDGFDTAVTTTSAIKCIVSASAATSLTILNSSIHNATQAGVDSSGCALTLDANAISANSGGGIKLASTTYTITNNFVTANATVMFPGFAADAGSSGTFRFNTVAKNLLTTPGIAGGIDCGSGVAKMIESSIIWGSSTTVGGSQFAGNCTLSNVVTGTDSATGAIQMNPAFQSGTDFHLVKDDPANRDQLSMIGCCVDKVSSATLTHDVDGTLRPKGGGFDIGAHEVQ